MDEPRQDMLGDNLSFIRKVPLFSELSEEEQLLVGELVLDRTYGQSRIIFMEGEPGEALFFVKSGRVKIFKLSEDGREQILDIMRAGDIFAAVAFLDGGPYPASAEALEDARIALIRNQDFERLIEDYPRIAIKVLKVLAGRLRRAHDQVTDLALKDTHGRMASMLLKLADQHGIRTPDGVLMDLALTHQQLASLIGTSRETVTRILRKFRHDGAIKIDKRGITVASESKLRGWM